MNVEDVQRALVVAISNKVVTLEGSEVAPTSELLSDDRPDWKISKLSEQLDIHRNNWQVTHPRQTFPGKLIIMADGGVDAKVLKKVLYSAGVAGYHQLHLAVRRKYVAAR